MIPLVAALFVVSLGYGVVVPQLPLLLGVEGPASELFVTAILVEISEEWETGKRYVTFETK